MKARFTLFDTTSGHTSAVHNSGTLVHSAQDPVAEAKAIATLLLTDNVRKILILGNGLGYLRTALTDLGVNCHTVELFEELNTLAFESNRFAADTFCSNAEELQSVLKQRGSEAHLVVAPYVMSLRSELPRDVRLLVEELQVTLQSQHVYKSIIDRNIRANVAMLHELPKLSDIEIGTNKLAIAIGSGPTLDACMPALVEWREQLVLIAASGAVPVLSNNGIQPDWIVAMEARDGVVIDLESAHDRSTVLVFPWTHPSVMSDARFKRVVASEADKIFTSGGATGLAAADFATKLTAGAVFMVGMDMSDSEGEYSGGSSRVTANRKLGAAKFNVMREAAAKWAQVQRQSIYHVVMPGQSEVDGAHKLYPMELATAFAREQNYIPVYVEAHA